MSQITVGRFGAPHGVRGWLRVTSYTNPIEQILQYQPWTVIRGDTSFTLEKVKGRLQGKHLVVQIPSCADRDTARTFTNLEICIDRERLPKLEGPHYYWVDLIGLTVINQENEVLGIVEQVLETGSNDVLLVTDALGTQRAIPYLPDVIRDVNLSDKKIRVDWDASF